jgi:hypothetical protein
MGGGTVPSKSRWLVQSSCVEGQTLRAATWLRLGRKREDSLVVVSAYLRPVSATRTQADWQPTWQLCLRTFCTGNKSQQRWWWWRLQRTHWSPRCRSKRAITSPTIREVTKDAQGASLVETLSECSPAWNRTGPDQNILATARSMSVVDYMLAPLGSEVPQR